MSRITALSHDQAPAAALPLLDGAKAKLGMVPNLFRTLAHSPATLGAYFQFSEALSHGVLTAPEREVIALAVGQANQCGYCLSAHTLIGKGAGLSAEAIRAARDGNGSTIAALAQKITVTRGQLNDADIATARATGLSDAQIIEVIAHVALNTLTNYVNHIAATVIDFPVVSI
jgi:uncharacterized peroxidase-related enzyme